MPIGNILSLKNNAQLSDIAKEIKIGESYTNWSLRPDGTPTVTDNGNILTLSRNSNNSANYTVINGKLTNIASNAAAAASYIEDKLDDNVTRIGAKFVLNSGTTSGGAVVLCVWKAHLIDTFPIIPDASCHLQISKTGWTFGVFNNNVLADINFGTFDTALTADGSTVYNVEVIMVDDTAYILLPDGYIATVTDLRIKANNGKYACWEVMQSNASTDCKGSFVTTWASSDIVNGVDIKNIIKGTGNASGVYSTSKTGARNTSSNSYSTVSGGVGNTASGINSTVGGGSSNSAIAADATVSGGLTNAATGSDSTVGGGSYNTASGDSSTVVGGSANTASGNGAVASGNDNVASAYYSKAEGYSSSASIYGSSVHASGKFATRGDAQSIKVVLRNTTTDATAIKLGVNGSGTTGLIAVDPIQTIACEALVVARRTDVLGECAAYKVTWAVKRSGGAASLLGTPVITVIAEDDLTWDVVPVISGNSFSLQVTGATGKTIRWVANIQMVSVE